MWFYLVKRCDAILPVRSAQSSMEWLSPGSANEAKAGGKPVPDGSKARQDLDLEKKSVVFVGVDADSIKTGLISGSRVGNALAKENRCVPGELKIL